MNPTKKIVLAKNDLFMIVCCRNYRSRAARLNNLLLFVEASVIVCYNIFIYFMRCIRVCLAAIKV